MPAELAEAAHRDRVLHLGLAAAHGPIFRYYEAGQAVICISDLAMGRRLLRAHSTALCPITVDITPLVPLGFLRQMRGDDHSHYRKCVTDALPSRHHPSDLDQLHRFAADALALLTTPARPPAQSADLLSDTLSDIATGFLLHIIFGVRPGSPSFAALGAGFHALGPHGLIWNIAKPQETAFHAIVAQLTSLSAADCAEGILQRVQRADRLDDTLLANLVYMVEMGRYDMKGLFRWLIRYAALYPDDLTQIADIAADDPDSANSYATAFVLETLRLEQSERLMRDVEADIVFEGYSIPKGAKLRICLWEAHKDRRTFARPFTFDPTRFSSDPPGKNVFSPFGLDQHHCPFSALAVQMATTFLLAVAQNFRLAPVNDGPAMRGAFHWEPPPQFYAIFATRHQ